MDTQVFSQSSYGGDGDVPRDDDVCSQLAN